MSGVESWYSDAYNQINENKNILSKDKSKVLRDLAVQYANKKDSINKDIRKNSIPDLKKLFQTFLSI